MTIRHEPYSLEDKREAVRASFVLKRKAGFCVAKAVFLAAVLRAQKKYPPALVFTDVKNHLITQRLKALMETDLFYYHGYIEVFLNDKWVKATPAFNLSFCRNFNVNHLSLMVSMIRFFMNSMPMAIATWNMSTNTVHLPNDPSYP